jgi:hypothetical protein
MAYFHLPASVKWSLEPPCCLESRNELLLTITDHGAKDQNRKGFEAASLVGNAFLKSENRAAR